MTMARPTLYAQRGLEFVAVFLVKLASFDVSGHRPLLRDPPGESTAGGKLATQHIVLQPADPSAPVWTVGSLNVATETAKIRTYDCMRSLHTARFRDKPFPLDREQYQRFFDAAAAFMKERSIALEVEEAPPEIGFEHSPSIEPAAPSGGRRGAFAAALVLVVLAIAAAAFFALRGGALL